MGVPHTLPHKNTNNYCVCTRFHSVSQINSKTFWKTSIWSPCFTGFCKINPHCKKVSQIGFYNFDHILENNSQVPCLSGFWKFKKDCLKASHIGCVLIVRFENEKKNLSLAGDFGFRHSAYQLFQNFISIEFSFDFFCRLYF